MLLYLPNYRCYLVLKRLSLVLGLLLISMIFVLGDTSLATNTLSFRPPLDKLLHICAYAAIAGLLIFSGVVRSAMLLWMLVVAVGMLDEWHQLSIAGRQAGLLDLLADATGACLGIWLMRSASRRMLIKDNVDVYSSETASG